MAANDSLKSNSPQHSAISAASNEHSIYEPTIGLLAILIPLTLISFALLSTSTEDDLHNLAAPYASRFLSISY